MLTEGEVINNSITDHGTYLLRNVIRRITNPRSVVPISIKRILSLEEALAVLVLDDENYEKRKKAIEFIKTESSKEKYIWGSLTPIIPIFHYLLFVKKDLEAAEPVYSLLKANLEHGLRTFHIDNALVKISVRTYVNCLNMVKKIKETTSPEELNRIKEKEEEILKEQIRTLIQNAKKELDKIEKEYNDPAVSLVKETMIAELGWIDPEGLSRAINDYENSLEILEQEDEIIEGFMIIRDDLKDISLKYFQRRAEVLRDELMDKSGLCQYLKSEKKKLEETLKNINNNPINKLVFSLLSILIWLLIGYGLYKIIVAKYLAAKYFVWGSISGVIIEKIITIKWKKLGIVDKLVNTFYKFKLNKIDKNLVKACTDVDIKKITSFLYKP